MRSSPVIDWIGALGWRRIAYTNITRCALLVGPAVSEPAVSSKAVHSKSSAQILFHGILEPEQIFPYPKVSLSFLVWGHVTTKFFLFVPPPPHSRVE